MPGLSQRLRPALIIVLLAFSGLALGAWALVEARKQRAETAEALATQARVLADTLGPSLSTTAAATRELDDLLTARLLDSAHLIARLQSAGALSSNDLAEIIDRSDLDSVCVVDHEGNVLLAEGEEVPPAVLSQVRDEMREGADDVILGSSIEMDVEHLSVASTVSTGGVVVARIHTTTGRTFAQQIGVENLLVSLSGSEGIVYLRYREEPGGVRGEASWDGGPLPPPAADRSELREVRGRKVFEIEVPVVSPAGTEAFLEVGLDGEPLARASVSAARRTTLIGIILVVLSFSLGGIGLVARWRALDREDAARRLDEAETARRRSERLAAAGALAAGLAHEVRSPLNAIVLAAQRIERKHPRESDCSTFAGTIRSEVSRLEAVLRQFLELARPVADERHPADLRQVADEVRQLLLAEIEETGGSIEPVAGSGTAVVDRNSIRGALINLVRNAMEADPRGGPIEIVLRGEDGGIGVHVLDRGTGIDESRADNLFDAFVTTRADGTGLGLALVRRVAEEHGGRCHLANRSGGGTEAVFWLPGADGGEVTT
jgi:signal transduction histidine kinase